MKVRARETQIKVHPYGGVTITFDCSVRAKEALQGATDTEYVISIDRVKNKRSLNQNALLWKLIGEIDKAENGRRTREDDEAIYFIILQMASIRTEVVETRYLTAVQALKAQFHVKVTEDDVLHTYVCEIFPGTSRMDTQEMNEVIEQALRYANEVGIDTDLWREELHEKTYTGTEG